MPDNRSLDQLAAEPLDDLDLALVAELATMWTSRDPMPDGLVERISFGITLDALEAEVAQLVRHGELAGARGGAAAMQTVTFSSGSLTTMVTIGASGPDRVRIDGWAAPGGGVMVELRIADGRRTTVADADGRFVFEDVPRGRAQFLFVPASGGGQASVITPALEL